MNSLSKSERAIWMLAAIALLAVRIVNLAGPLDEPSWRQAWCAHHARVISQGWPSNWMANYINFRGPNETSYWTLPLYETVVAIGYRAAGGEYLWLARAVAFLAYAWAAYLLFLIAAELFDRRVGMFAALAFLALPLGIFYSRAVHYESLLIALSHVFLLYALRFCRDPSWSRWALSVSAGIVAALIKPTFIMWMGPVVLVWAVIRFPRGKVWALAAVCALFLLPVGAALGHHYYRLAMEGGIANTALYADPYNPSYARGWFLGSLQERLNVTYWQNIMRLTVWMVFTPGGALLAILSLVTVRRFELRTGWMGLAAWILGLVIYVLVFTHIVATHDYWRLPFLAPAALVIGLTLGAIAGPRASGPFAPGRLALLLGAVFLFAIGIRPAFLRGPYFQNDWQRIVTGEAIRENTHRDELVVSTVLGRATGGTDPRILYHADRLGWACLFEDLSQERFEEYRSAGVSVIALLVTPEQMPLPQRWQWMVECKSIELPLRDREDRGIGSLWLYWMPVDGPSGEGGQGG